MTPPLRLGARCIARVADEVAFSFDGEPIRGFAGESLAAALAASGRLHLGWGADGTPSGVFCGMGVCGACLVSVDGMPSQRACLTTLRAGMRVQRQGDRARVPAASAPDASALPRFRQPEVLVIGGGPAGLQAARAARLCGAEAALIDEREELGGQYFKRLSKSYRIASPVAAHEAMRQGGALIDEVERLGVAIWRSALVWGAFAPAEFAVAADGEQYVLRPRSVVLATGAVERAIPMPGWVLPGFMTTGAAQTLLRAYRVAPGRRVLVAGNGPMNLQLAAEFVRAGLKPVAVIEAAPPLTKRMGALIQASCYAPRLIARGASYLARLRAAGVPIVYRSAVTAVRGEVKVEEAILVRLDESGMPVLGSDRVLSIDTVCFNHGFLPSNGLALALGCSHHWNPTLRCLLPDLDGDGRTSVPEVFAAGDSATLGGAQAGMEQGFIAGVAAARATGRRVPARVQAELEACRRRLARHQSFQKGLWTLFSAPLRPDLRATADTVVCRCESVTMAAICSALEAGALSPGAVKRRTRAGMGRCQGRYCAHVLVSMIESTRGSIAPAHHLAPRPPVLPVRIADVAVLPNG